MAGFSLKNFCYGYATRPVRHAVLGVSLLALGGLILLGSGCATSDVSPWEYETKQSIENHEK